MKVVVDTNCLLPSIPRDGKGKWLYDAFYEGRFTWVISNEILSEYTEIISNEFSPKAADLVVALLVTSPNHSRYEPFFRWGLITEDPDDNKFVDCAIGANVDYLVTDDKHILNLLKRDNLFPPVPVVSLAQFKRILAKLR
ncbi:MAG: putative toxin-antitoxin system toxin component, PIN family [Cytophagaceae bacterium]|nr:MAG: putative toxin-antitoxin system toxin component, PIN family [Cytophagaceae bacterium]